MQTIIRKTPLILERSTIAQQLWNAQVLQQEEGVGLTSSMLHEVSSTLNTLMGVGPRPTVHLQVCLHDFGSLAFYFSIIAEVSWYTNIIVQHW